MKADILILRVTFVGLLILLGYLLNPFERTQRFGLVNIVMKRRAGCCQQGSVQS